jgi:uncharacterized membrane protein YfcA
MSVNFLMIIGLGAAVGILSGMFGVGGGFLMTPILFFIGIPPAVAVSTEANQIVASSVSGVLAHWKRGNVDIPMGIILTIGGFIGSSAGVQLFSVLKGLGQVDLVIKLCYVVFLGIIGGLMLLESIQSLRNQKAATGKRKKLHTHTWIHGLPFKVRFRKSKLYISALLPLLIGFFVGVIAAIMGVGGGFILVPAMIYLLGMPTAVVIGTSLFQIIFVMINVTVQQAYTNQTVDIVLALLLLIGGVVGAQLGARIGAKLKAEQLRILLALMVLGVCSKLGLDLIIEPADLFSIGQTAGH